MEASTYFIIHQGQQAGPYSREQLQALMAGGQITSEQLCWCDGMADWQPLGEILPQPQAGPPPLPVRKPMMPARPAPAPKKKSLTWLWVTLACVVLLIGGSVAMIGVAFTRVFNEVVKDGTDLMAFKPLFEERAQHQPKWRDSSFEAAGPAEAPDGKVFELIRYLSPAGEMAAYLTPDPKDGKKHPAIIWAHGGFGGIGSYFWEPAGKRNDQSARAFREKGIVMMCPSWRGENDNSGRFELFYGEVVDFLSAIQHVKKLPYVDPSRVYIGGHSTGGTMTLLAAVSSDQFRAAFSFGGMIDGVQTLGDGEGYGNTPYDPNSKMDHRLRSPMRYANFIRCPTFYFEGGKFYDEASAEFMKLRAVRRFQTFHLPGDHFDILHPITGLIADKILQDTGTECCIQFTDQELRQRYNAAFSETLATQLGRWAKNGGSLAEFLEKADPDDVMPRSIADVEAVVMAVQKISTKADDGAPAINDIAALAMLGGVIENDAVRDAFDTKALPVLIGWGEMRLRRPEPFDDKRADAFFDLLESLVESEHESATALVVAAVRRGTLPDSYGWSRVFGAFYHEHPHAAALMAAFRENPPAGFTGVLLLDAANELFLDDWEEGPHPFDSTTGADRLRIWLESKNPDEYTHAHSAALGVSFIAKERRGGLLALALQHPDPGVRMEGAWADARNGGAQGLAKLKKACLEMHRSDRAQDYLRELGHEKDIPNEALEPSFSALATMSNWLQHPNELGAEPMSIEVYDHKRLYWPPTEDTREIWLIKFTYKFEGDAAPQIGYGCTGSMTWSSFNEYPAPPNPEELYLHHCALEMERDEKRTENAAKKVDANARALAGLKKGNPGMFKSPNLQLKR